MRHWIIHIRLAQCINVTIKSRTEQQALATWLGEIQNFAHDWHKAHVCHLVSFIKYGDFNTAQVDRSTISEVHQTTWCCYEHVYTAIKCINLLCVWHTASDQAQPKFSCISNRAKSVVDLHRQFTSRNKNQAQWLTAMSSLTQQVGEGCKSKGQGLARTGLRTSQNVAARNCVRQRCDLNSERFHDPLASKSRCKSWVNTKIGK
ncbi:unannotated protein [freshwater metagenome]|uniref:Unannotated protein n=1 Tax=freshwater metagenome TaxID=449393 RepID=A0A6J6MJ33_9ZZZZ